MLETERARLAARGQHDDRGNEPTWCDDAVVWLICGNGENSAVDLRKGKNNRVYIHILGEDFDKEIGALNSES